MIWRCILLKPVNIGGHSAYQNRVLTQLRKYYPNAVTSLPLSTWQIPDKFWPLDLSAVDTLMQGRYSPFDPEPRLFKNPPRDREEWKSEFHARTSSERCNKREKIDYKLEDGRYRSSMMWYCRLFAIMMCQHLDARTLSKTSLLKDRLDQVA